MKPAKSPNLRSLPAQRSLLAALLTVALSLAGTLPAAMSGAQDTASASLDEEARGLFQSGAVAFEAGRFEAALARWQEAYELSRRPALQYNIGLALDRLRRDQAALEAFRAYLNWDSSGERAQEVQGRVEAIEKALVAEQAETVQTSPAPIKQSQLPSPAVAAATVEAGGASAPLDVPASEPSLTQQWWFWPSVGAVATSVLVGIVVAVSAGDSPPDVQAPLQPAMDVGLSYEALRRGPRAGVEP